MKWMLVVILVLVGVLIRHEQSRRITAFPLKPTIDFRRAIVTSVRLSGVTETYRKLSLQLSTLDYLQYHSAAHVFGATVYQLMGIRGVPVCDEKFTYGCFHGFSIVAVKTQGVTVIPKLMDVCKGLTGKKRGSCLHGIGHGIGEYFGPDRLIEQLDYCAHVDDSIQKSCPGGVMMQYFEYYSPNSLMPPSVELAFRPYDATKPYGPCPSLPSRYQKVCYAMLPGWWWFVIAPDASMIGQLCYDIENSKHRNSCFEGSGFMIAQVTKDNRDEAVALCRKMASVGGELLCRTKAAEEFWLHPESHEKAASVCDGLPESERQICVPKNE